jgi:hypothetical protein
VPRKIGYGSKRFFFEKKKQKTFDYDTRAKPVYCERPTRISSPALAGEEGAQPEGLGR